MKNILTLIIVLFAYSSAQAADYLVTSAGAGTGSGATWANAMSYAQFETSVEGAVSAGDRYFLMGNQTYTLTSDLTNIADGTATSPISVIGVASGTTAEPPTTSDYAEGTDRPTLTTASNYTIYFDDYWQFWNLIMTSNNTTQTFRADTGSLLVNSKVTNTGVTAYAIDSNGADIIGCEAQTDDGAAIHGYTDIKVLYSYIHDSDTCLDAEQYMTIAFNIFDTCTVGIDATSEYGLLVLNNVLYNGTTGITGVTSYSSIFINNAITSFTTGASFTTDQLSNYFDYNNWNGNTADVSNATKGPNATAVAPGYTNAGGGDFSLTVGSAMRNSGQNIELGVD